MFLDIYKGKKVLVTGHTGFKGAWLSQWLVSMGAEVYGLALAPNSDPSLFKLLKLEEQMTSRVVDIRNYEALKATILEFAPDMIFHLAAEAIVRTCYDDPKLCFDTNLGGTVNMMEAIRCCSSVKSAVFITSDKCYENVEWEYGYRETDQLGGKDPYSASKASAELAISAFHRSYFAHNKSIQVASARAGNVIGGGDWAKDRIVPDCMRTWGRNETVEIRSPRATRPWQHVLEPLSGYLWLGANLFLQNEQLDGQSFNFGPKLSADYPVIELLNEMKKIWGSGEVFVNEPKDIYQKEAGLLRLSCDKASSRLNWEAVMSFEETVSMTVSWYKKFYEQGDADIRKLTTGQIELYQTRAKARGLSWTK
jgi:CDP-glucose 4,6-dehydratase